MPLCIPISMRRGYKGYATLLLHKTCSAYSITHAQARARTGAHQKQINTPLKDDYPERPTITLAQSLEHPLGILTNNISVILFDFMVSRSGWHRNRGVSICSRAQAFSDLLKEDGVLAEPEQAESNCSKIGFKVRL